MNYEKRPIFPRNDRRFLDDHNENEMSDDENDPYEEFD